MSGARGSGPEALARRVAAIADSKQAGDIVALDVGELVGYTDYLVICTARNERQARAVLEEVRVKLKGEGRIPNRVQGERDGRWIVVDYLECVLHVFDPETRDRYRLETLWGEAPRLDLGIEGGEAAAG